MDELTMFAELRPDDTLSDSDLDALRDELFPGFESARRDAGSDRGHDVVLPLAGDHQPVPHPHRRPARVALAAAAVAAVGLGGLWAIADRDDASAPIAPASQPTQPLTAPPVAPTPSEFDVPLIGLVEPGWTVTNAYDNAMSARRAVVLLSEAGFDGPWIEVRTFGSATGGPIAAPGRDGTVTIGDATAQVTEIEDGVILRWTDPSGNAIEAFGWQVDLDQTAAVARGTAVTDTAVALDHLPVGAQLADESASIALGRYASYRFTHTDGREVEITLTPGGARGLYQRQGPASEFHRDGRTEVLIGEEPATIVDWSETGADPPPEVDPADAHEVESPGGEFRVDIRRGFWTWEFSTARFTSEQQVIDLVAGSSVVDPATWEASLADDIVTPAERSAAVQQVLADVPLPPGFDAQTLITLETDSRYHFIAEVSSAVVCSWFDEWFAGEASGDAYRRDAAAAALATSPDWAMLREIADQGGWSDVVWGYADPTNTSLPASEAPQELHGSLGC